MLWMLIIYCVANLFLLGVGVGIGFLLRWILAVDLGVGILIGVVTTIASVNFLLRINRITEQIEDETLLQEITSRRALRVVEAPPAKQRRRRKPRDSEPPR